MTVVVLALAAGREQPWLADAAGQIAREMGAEVAVVAVDDIESQRYATRPRESYVEDAARAADAAAERLVAAGVSAASHVRAGRELEEILAFADERDAGAIVVGPASHGRVAGIVLGDLTLRLVQRSSRPVIVVTAPG